MTKTKTITTQTPGTPMGPVRAHYRLWLPQSRHIGPAPRNCLGVKRGAEHRLGVGGTTGQQILGGFRKQQVLRCP